ncbi:MAG TPA: efflux RND transporter periplasmic adaptor subunit [Candidatus Moranbacteria bacterium]|nr:efflux RND transporter periplasmic adaptor subunit [Candidatus Moranbacteria bacterium]
MKLSELAKKNKKYIIIATIILIAGGYYWYSKSSSKNTAVQYKTATVEKGTLAVSVSGSGNVIVDQSSNIDPTITGTVQNLSVSVGDKVEKGQFLFDIKNDDLSLNVTKAYASYLSSLQSLESAKANKKEARTNLDEANSTNKSALKKKHEAAQIAVSAAEESVKSALQNYQNEKSNYSDRKVTAPISGTVNEINIKNGDDLSKLSSGSSREVPIIIGDLGTMKAQVQINEVDIANVNIGQEVALTFSAIDGLNVAGKVEKIDSIGTLSSGVVTYNVTINFDTLDSRIKPEMSVSASINTQTKQDVIVVPSGAVKIQNGENYVEVLNSGQTPVEIKVKTGVSNDTETEITSGLKTGDKIVTQTIGSSSTASTSSSSSNKGGGMRIPGL